MKSAGNYSFAPDSNLGRSAPHGDEISTAMPARHSFAFLSSIVAVGVVGFVFSFLPYFLWWHGTGHFVYIADKDNQYYLQLASRLYYGNLFSMRDPVLPHGVTMYQSLQFFPAVLLVRILGLPTLDVNAIWHLWVAVAMPATFYLVFFHWLRRPWAAAFCTIVMLADCGVLTAEPFLLQFIRSYQMAAGHLSVLYDGQDLLGQWRIVDPAVGMPLLLIQVFVVSLAAETPEDRRLPVAAGVSTALLFYLWFYYWTAAVGALALAFILDRRAQRAYATILGVAFVGGLPAIVDGLLVRRMLSSEALHRIGFFASVPRLGFFCCQKSPCLHYS